MSIRTHLVLRVLLAAGTVIALAGCGSDSSSPGTSTTSTSTAQSTTTATTTIVTAATSARAYFVRAEKVAPVRRSVEAATPARGALESLLAAPTAEDVAAGLSSAIPAGTTLLGLDIAAGVATADLSGQFGSGGGSLSMQERVAQVVYTLTQFPTVQKVAFRMDGAPVTMLGGEGLMIGTPQTRNDWEAMTPAILVENPLPGDQLSSPFQIDGTANTFEATFRVSLVDSAGTSVYDNFVTATSGTGTRGTFSAPIAFSTPKAGPGVLKVYESSAKDGSEINVVTFAVVV